MPNILVTGGAGYIGSHTVHLLSKRGYNVVVVDDLSRGHEHNIKGHRYHRISLLDTRAIAEVLRAEAIDAVIHFAAYISVGESTQNPELYFTNNVSGSLSLLTAMRETGIKRLVFSSTAAVYGNPPQVPIPEDLPYAPVSPYGDSKVMVEKVLRWLDQFCDVRSIALRYFNACGAEPGSGLGEEHEPETHLIPLLFRAVETGKPVSIFGTDYPTPDGTCVRDYIHVSDLAQAHIAAVQSLLEGGESGIYNVGTGSGKSVLEVMKAVEEVTGKSVPHVIAPRREGDPAELVADSSRLQSRFGWRPQYTEIRDIVRTAWEFHQSLSSRTH